MVLLALDKRCALIDGNLENPKILHNTFAKQRWLSHTR
jgi:hypothetical protein